MRNIVLLITLFAGLSNSAAADFVRPRSYLELRFQHTVKQARDFTCGAAALATILKHHYNLPVTESLVVDLIVKRYTIEEWKNKVKDGLSFDDLIFAAKQLGVEAQAALVSIEELSKLSAPVIVQLDYKENDHFSVLRKKISNDAAYISDPIFGGIVLEEGEFKEKYRGAVLAVWPSYVKGDFFSGLSVIRDPVNVEKVIGPILAAPPAVLPLAR